MKKINYLVLILMLAFVACFQNLSKKKSDNSLTNTLVMQKIFGDSSSSSKELSIVPRGKTFKFENSNGEKIITYKENGPVGDYEPFERTKKEHLTKFFLGDNWDVAASVPPVDSYMLTNSTVLEEDGSLTTAWIDMKGKEITKVRDIKGQNEVTLSDKTPATTSINVGKNLIISKISKDGTIKTSRLLVEGMDFYHEHRTFAGIQKLSPTDHANATYVVAYRRADYLDRYKQDGSNWKKIGIFLPQKNNNINTERDFLDKEIAAAKDATHDPGGTKSINMSRLNISLFTKDAIKNEATPIIPTPVGITHYGNGASDGKDYYAADQTTTSRWMPPDVLKGNYLGTKENPRWWLLSLYSYGGSGRLVANKDKTTFAIYTSSIGKFKFDGGKVPHQRDAFAVFDYKNSENANKKLETQVGFHRQEIAHMWRPRIASDGDLYITAGVGDHYPRDIKVAKRSDRGLIGQFPLFYYLEDTPKGIPGKLGSNQTYATVGDVLVMEDSYVVTFVTATGRNTMDAGFVFFNKELRAYTSYGWLTKNAGPILSKSKHTLYITSSLIGSNKDKVLFAWEVVEPDKPFSKQGETFFAVADNKGKLLYGPDKAGDDVILPVGDQFFTYQNGDIGWIIGKDKKLRVYRLKTADLLK